LFRESVLKHKKGRGILGSEAPQNPPPIKPIRIPKFAKKGQKCYNNGIMKMIKVITAFLVVFTMFFFVNAQAEEKQKVNILIKAPYFNQITDLSDKNLEYAGGTACGPTSLAIMLKYSGLDVDPNDVLKMVPLEVYIPKLGFVDIKAGASYFNREAVDIEFSHKNIYKTLDQGHPVFINIFNYDSGYKHGAVIVGLKNFDGEKAESLVIHDVWTKGYQEFKFHTNDTLVEPGNGNINVINKALLFYIK